MTGVKNCNIVIDVAMVPANLVQLLDDPISLVDKFEKVLDGDSLVIVGKRIQEWLHIIQFWGDGEVGAKECTFDDTVSKSALSKGRAWLGTPAESSTITELCVMISLLHLQTFNDDLQQTSNWMADPAHQHDRIENSPSAPMTSALQRQPCTHKSDQGEP